MGEYRVGARMTDGKIQQFKVGAVDSPEAAREGVRLQVPRAKVILALVGGGKGTQPVAPGTEVA